MSFFLTTIIIEARLSIELALYRLHIQMNRYKNRQMRQQTWEFLRHFSGSIEDKVMKNILCTF